LVAESSALVPPAAESDAEAAAEPVAEPVKLSWREQIRPSNITEGLPTFPLVVLCITLALRQLDDRLLTVLSPEIKRAFHMGNTGIATLTAVTTPFALLLDPVVSYYADRKNRTRMLAVGIGVYALFTALTGLAGMLLVLPLLFLARAGAASMNSFSSTRNSLLSDYYPARIRPKVFYATYVAGTFGDVFGPVLAGVLGMLIGWEWPFILMAIPPLLCVFLFVKLKEPKRGYHERLDAGLDHEAAEVEDNPAGFFETFRELWKLKSAKRIYLSLPFLAASLIGLLVLVNLYYDEVFHVSPAGRGLIAGFITEPFQIAGLIFGFVIVQRISAKNPGRALSLLGVCGVFQGACIVVMAAAPNLAVAVAANALLAAGQALLLPGVLAVISMAIPPRMRTLGFATGNLWILLGAPAIVFAGSIADSAGIRFGLLCFLPIFLIGSFILASAGKFLTEDIEKAVAS
jgi:MFS family permease